MEQLMPLPLACKCGASARIRYKIPVVWVECRKGCGMKTGYHVDKKIPHDPESEAEAIVEWNRIVSRKTT